MMQAVLALALLSAAVLAGLHLRRSPPSRAVGRRDAVDPDPEGALPPDPTLGERTEVRAWTRGDLWTAWQSSGLRWDVPPELLAAIAWQESRFAPAARGASGEIGMFQFMPPVGRELLRRELGGLDGVEVERELEDPVVAGDLAAQLLDELWRNLELDGDRGLLGDWELAIHGYNLGQGAVERGGRNTVYASSVLNRARANVAARSLASVIEPMEVVA